MIGQTLSHFEITAKLGEGGMGEVWRAHDTRLDREVAIKVLPEVLTSDRERLARLQREAKVLASLNHPHIGGIHGLEKSDEVLALVLELVEGPTLGGRIARGPIPLDEALPIARQIAEALDAAHTQGVIHRDLKPANIKITPDGTVKVLDFGLAKATGKDALAPDISQSPTLSMTPTEEGIILGTPAYMAPEQARGRPTDNRADIWAFGVVLWEMLTGKRLFEGETLSDTLAAVLRGEPGWEALPRSTPPALRRLLDRCLQKDPERRLRDVGDALLEIEDAEREMQAPAGPGKTQRTGLRRWGWALILGATAIALATGLSLGRMTRPPPENLPAVFEIHPPPDAVFTTWESARPLISPDGKHIVFGARDATGERLWIRPLDGLAARPLEGTDYPLEAFWSADSQQVAFSSALQEGFWTVASGGGPPQLLTRQRWRLGTWNQAADLVISRLGDSLYLLPAAAKGEWTLEPLTTLSESRQEHWHWSPQFLPDGKHFLFYVFSREDEFEGTYIASLDSPDKRKLLLAGLRATYAAPSYLLFVQEGSLMARHFDPHRLEATGSAIPVVERLAVLYGKGLFTTSSNGVLTYREPIAVDATLTWFDREGNSLDTLPVPEGAQNPELSPSGRELAFERYDPETGSRDIWIWDFNRESATKFTTHPADDSDAVWAPDGRSLIFSSERYGNPDLFRKEVGSSGAPELIFESDGGEYVTSWGPDEVLVITQWAGSGSNGRLMLLALSEPAEPTPLLDSDSQEVQAQFSPDGNWIAYVATQSGRPEVYIQPFPLTGDVSQVSTRGGTAPRWRGDGKEIYYLDPGRVLMAVALTPAGTTAQLSTPQELFPTRSSGPAIMGVRISYDVSANGQRFLIHTASNQARTSSIVVVTDWTERLNR